FVELAVVDSDEQKVQKLREELDAAGLYGKVTVHHCEAADFHAPRYVANTVFVGKELSLSADDSLLRSLYESVRPYGGTLHLLAGDKGASLAERIAALQWEQAEAADTGLSVAVRRVGRLPGS